MAVTAKFAGRAGDHECRVAAQIRTRDHARVAVKMLRKSMPIDRSLEHGAIEQHELKVAIHTLERD